MLPAFNQIQAAIEPELARKMRMVDKREKLKRRRIQLSLTEKSAARLDRLKSDTGLTSYSNVVRDALLLYDLIAEERSKGSRIYIRPKDGEKMSPFLAIDTLTELSHQGHEQLIYNVTNNMSEIRFGTSALIHTLDETLEYDPARHHNTPPPYFWTKDEDTKNLLSQIRDELRKLNELLETGEISPQHLHSHADFLRKATESFIDSFASIAGKGTGLLFLGTLIYVLSRLGIGEGAIQDILGRTSQMR